jgi:hypothetical protein
MQTEQATLRATLKGFKSRITGMTTIMTDEDRIHQDTFVREYVQELDPWGKVELQLARTIALDNWRLNRVKTAEENIFAYGLVLPGRIFTNEIMEIEHAIGHAYTFLQHNKAINNISLYESRLNRIIATNLDLLMKRQTERKKSQPRSQPAPAQVIPIRTAGAAASAPTITELRQNRSDIV